jgi:predicted ATP-grasp superfamily ATP-dependent carboligase
MTEKTIWPISLAREMLAQKTLLLIPPHEILINALDKWKTINAAKASGIPVPKTYPFDGPAGVHILSHRISYPVVVKPTRSENIVGNQVLPGGRPQYASSPKALVEILDKFDRRLASPLIQEFIPGTGHGVFALFCKGEPIVWFAHRRLRDVRPTGSGSSFRESVEVDEDIKSYSETLLRSFRWHGVAMVEFRRDSRDGVPKLMEVNGRFWNSVPLAIASGVDFPYLLYRTFANLGNAQSIEYQKQVKCQWLLGDIRHFLEVMRGKPKEFKGAFPSRSITFRNILRDTFDAKIHHDVWSLKDPLPFIVEVLELMSRAMFKKSTI